MTRDVRLRDTSLNAEPYFVPPDGKKPPLQRNQFGGVVGGPLVQNRAFFFGDYEGFRQDKQQTVFSTLPTAAQAYVRTLEEISGARVSAIGVGPRRDQTIEVNPLL